MSDPFEKKAAPDFDAILREVQSIEDDIKELTDAGEVSEFQDTAHYLFEGIVDAVYSDPGAFWEAYSNVSS